MLAALFSNHIQLLRDEAKLQHHSSLSGSVVSLSWVSSLPLRNPNHSDWQISVLTLSLSSRHELQAWLFKALTRLQREFQIQNKIWAQALIKQREVWGGQRITTCCGHHLVRECVCVCVCVWKSGAVSCGM